MGDIEIFCPHCDEALDVPEDLLGEVVDCPVCGQSLQVPWLEPEESVPQPSEREVTACPFCGEEILAVAIKCKHCRSDLDDIQGPAVEPSEAVGTLALLLPMCAALVAWFWLGNMSLLQDPGSKLSMISIITVIMTSILVAVEANSVGAGSETDLTARGNKREGPITWFFGCILLWIGAFPAWMFRRARYGLRNMGLLAIVVGLIFVGVTVSMHCAIEEAKAEVRRVLNNANRQMQEAQREMERTHREIEKAQRDLQNLWSE